MCKDCAATFGYLVGDGTCECIRPEDLLADDYREEDEKGNADGDLVSPV